jgi:hypothetical protein
MKVLVLVIVSFDKPVYYDMLTVWKKRINEKSNTEMINTDGCMTDGCMTDVWFIQNKSDKEWVGDIINDLKEHSSTPLNKQSHSLKDRFELDISNKTLYVKGEECLIPGILHKTVEALSFFLGEEGSKGNYVPFIWRTNLSSVLDFAGLERHLSTISSTKALYSGYIGLGSLNNGSSSFFASGAGFLLSRDVAEYLVENKDFLRWDLIDDVAIGALLEPKYGIVPLDRCWVQTTDENIPAQVSSGIFHFRCESYQHLRTVEFMRYVDEALAKK